jgi:predicted Rossmann fold flavoprotein
MGRKRIAIIGGGAAGFFAAIHAAESNPAATVLLFEATAHPLAKVRVSGGGRCNVTHACFDPRDLVAAYPRGSRELLGPFHKFGPREVVEWFAERGVPLKTESDGRMFPVTDKSATIVNCLLNSARAAGVQIETRCGVSGLRRDSGGSTALTLLNGSSVEADCVLIATGGNRSSAGAAIAAGFGHTILNQVPSLFTFPIDDARLRGLEGISVPDATVSVTGTNLCESGPLLITHWGVSGPVILRLSAWGARELHAMDYHFSVSVSWVGSTLPNSVTDELVSMRTQHPRRKIAAFGLQGLPSRLWERLVSSSGTGSETLWNGLSNERIASLVEQITRSEFRVSGKSMNKEEFVTCGGVSLREVDFRTMESRLCPGLHFAGEVLDIDGITGGFNFQAAWTTGWLAGAAMAHG